MDVLVLEKHIADMQQQLNKLIAKKHYFLRDPQIQTLSEQIDLLIIQYQYTKGLNQNSSYQVS